jgi:NAD(P)-dependent dehydrogenase (short-subunit alcohol dehydrogenase family)
MISGRPGVTPTIPTMDVRDRVVVVTGAGNGIGAAIARAVHGAGARGVVVADVDRDRAGEVAAALDAQRPGTAIALHADVSTEAANAALVDAATEGFGPIDVFFANAGIAVGTDLADTDEATWRLAFDVNVHAHRWAAKHLLPGWLARGEGYFVSTASAAGLLAQIGSAPYSVTKHAAVAFAEWLSITYGDRGVRVSCLCPQGVNTAMINGPAEFAKGVGAVRASGKVLEPDDVAEVVLAAVAAERFLILPHAEVHDFVQRKAADPDRWLAGMRRLQARLDAAE